MTDLDLSIDRMIVMARAMQLDGQYINGGIFHALANEVERLRAELQKPALHEPCTELEALSALTQFETAADIYAGRVTPMQAAINSVLQSRAKPAQEVNDVERLDIYADEGGTLIVTPNPNGEYIRACDYDVTKRLPAQEEITDEQLWEIWRRLSVDMGSPIKATFVAYARAVIRASKGEKT